MDPRVIALHDEAMRLRPDDASHDGSLCPICVDWSLDESGVPSCFDRLSEAEKQAPYGDVEYADDGLLAGGVKRYPLDTEAHVDAALEFLSREDAQRRYSSDELAQVRQRTQAAKERLSAKSQEAASDDEHIQEGGSSPVSDSITQETHEALVAKAVDDAVADRQAEISALQEQIDSLTEERDTAQARIVELETANSDIHAELDQAQVQVQSLTEERDQLKDDIAKRDEEASITELASKRAEQVRNLGLFPEDYVSEKARSWARLPDEDWAARLDEWKAVKGDATPSPDPSHDQASAMSGKSGEISSTPTARRRVLGLG